MTSLDAALSYALRGWKVMPVHSITEDGICSCGARGDYLGVHKHAMGKHPYTEHGHKDASKDPAQIILWWQMWPDANVAIATGSRSQLIVLDVDAKNDGMRSLLLLERKYGKLPRTPKVYSGGGGAHYFFEYPGYEIRGRRGMRDGIDVMADGGRINAPPSNHKSGWKYRWDSDLNPDNVPLAPIPAWLLKEIKSKQNLPAKRKINFANLFGGK